MFVKQQNIKLFVFCVSGLASAVHTMAHAELGTRGSIDLRPVYDSSSPPPIIFEPTYSENFQSNLGQTPNDQPGISFKDWAAPIDSDQYGAGQGQANPNAAKLVFVRDTTTGEMKTFIGGIKPGVNVIRPKEKYKAPQPVPASFSLQNSVKNLEKSPLTTVGKATKQTPTTEKKPRFVAGTYPGFRSLNRSPSQNIQNQPKTAKPPIQIAKLAPDSLVLAPRNYSILFSQGALALKPQVAKQIVGIAREVKKDQDARLEIQSYATGPQGRRIALARALMV
ncbi:MAG: hypothetical protein ACPGVN_03645, partial [Alphaproteobacteria bacterium]